MIRLLQVLPALNICGGIESYAMNYYRHMDKSLVQSDFITHTDLECSFKDEIEAMGGRVFQFPVFSIKKLKPLLSRIDNFLKENRNKYDIIHCHMANAAVFYFYLAKRYGYNIRILHSHQPFAADIFSHKIRNIPLLYLGNLLATHRLACAEPAGNFLFGNKSFTVMNNAVDVKKFSYDSSKRKVLRNALNLDDKIIIGHAGRFCAQKNQTFVLKIFEECLKLNDKLHLVFVGDGEDRPLIENVVKGKRLEEHVTFVGSVDNINEYYQAFDAFLFPSLYEGFPVVLVEAQCSGLPIIASKNHIPQEVKVNDNFHFVSLEENSKVWANKVIDALNNNRTIDLNKFEKHGLSIEYNVNQLEKYYQSLV